MPFNATIYSNMQIINSGFFRKRHFLNENINKTFNFFCYVKCLEYHSVVQAAFVRLRGFPIQLLG